MPGARGVTRRQALLRGCPLFEQRSIDAAPGGAAVVAERRAEPPEDDRDLVAAAETPLAVVAVSVLQGQRPARPFS